jgi:peptidoglycan-associated lipoprotein
VQEKTGTRTRTRAAAAGTRTRRPARQSGFDRRRAPRRRRSRRARSGGRGGTPPRSAIAAKVYFDYDKDEIRDDAKATLDSKVAILNANTAVRLRIAGHTDDRGSDEYNLALGQRRAASVQRYLVAHGVAASRFETVSFGKERPAAQGENEGAWSLNRRAEFEIIAGGDMLRMPK